MAENHNITFLWKIENFYYCPQEEDECLQSPEFYVNALSESAWELRMYPNCVDRDEVKVYLCNNYYNRNSTLFIDYEISFLSADGSVLVTGKQRNIRIHADCCHQISTYPTYDEIFDSRREEFQPQGTLTIQCRIWKTRKSLTHSIQYFARSRIGIQSRYFHWAVAEFSQLKLNGKKRTHRIIGGEKEPTFSIELCLKGATASQASVSIDLGQVTNTIPRLFSMWKISVLDATCNIVKSDEDNTFLSPGDTPHNFPSFLTRNELTARTTEWLVGDVLNLLFNVTFSTDENYCNIESVSSLPTWIPNTTTDDDSKAKEVPQGVSLDNGEGSDQNVISEINVGDQCNDASLTILQEDLLSLYEDETLSDFELRSGFNSFSVHKNVLLARSPVFKAMFSSDMKEGTADFLDVPDVDASTLDRFLKFVYTGTVADLECESAYKLYYAADKYEVLSLKQKCSAFLASNISDSNVCEILILADRHNDEGLRSSIHDYIVLNDDQIIRSTQWKRFLVKNSLLAAETMQMIYSKRLDIPRK